MNALAIHIVHPAFENLRRMGRLFHLIAGLLILFSALHQFQTPVFHHRYFWTQLMIALDILLVVIASPDLAREMPKVNMVLRTVETLLFAGAGGVLLLEGNSLAGIALLLVAIAFGYLLYCERNLQQDGTVIFGHTGVSVSGLPQDRFFLWSVINDIEIRYQQVTIHTAGGRSYDFPLHPHLAFEELDQIHEFCRHYLKKGI